MEAGKTLPIHTGDFKGVLRYHLGLECPEDPCARRGRAAGFSSRVSRTDAQISCIARVTEASNV